MTKALITGATGNVGRAVIEHLLIYNNVKIRAGVRYIKKGQFPEEVELVQFDFEDPATFVPALIDIDTIFLLRPPHLSNVAVFEPLIVAAKAAGCHIVFLSVQGVEKSKIIPHYKIEQLIINAGIKYTMLRPSYFMQNLTTTLLKDIKEDNRIYIPAGKAKFNWIDVNDIGAAAAEVISHIKNHQKKIYTITGKENLGFKEAAKMLAETTRKNITYKSPDLFSFFIKKKQHQVPVPMILVMIMLHFLPRFQNEPEISDDYRNITGQEPNTLKDFIMENRNIFK